MTTKQIGFIDSRVAGYETLIAGLDTETQWHVLDAQQDGIAQIERLLADESALDAIQIISHGAPAPCTWAARCSPAATCLTMPGSSRALAPA